ncbi:MAG: sulfatase-like hydrolase/transferase [Pseudomonadota bacterium]
MRFILALIAVLTVPMTAHAAGAPPNILLVIADDMGVDASPCHAEGSDLVRMPVLSALCRDGMVFDAAYASPTCSPTRATIMTGRYGSRTGIGGAIRPDNAVTLDDGEVSLFDRLAETGRYSAALIGKWHLTADAKDHGHPARLGVDHFFGLYSGGAKDYSNWTAVEATGGTAREVEVKTYATTEISNRAIDWIMAQSGPWFLWLAYTAPHSPFHVPPADLHSFSDLAEDAQSIRRAPQRHYFAALQAMDTELGRVLGALDPQVRANTIILFIGDNGTPGQVRRADGMRDRAKGSIYDGGTRVPLVVNGPGVAPGRTSALVNTTDLYATILGLAGGAPKSVDSIDFRAVLSGQAQTQRGHAYVEHFSNARLKGAGSTGWAIRDGSHKLVQRESAGAELYDLAADPDERQNLLASPSPGTTAIANRLKAAREALLR